MLEATEVLGREFSGGSLEEDERAIRDALVKGREAMRQLGFHLARIQAHPEWVADEFETFERYVSARWEISRRRAYQLIDFAKLVHLVHTAGVPELPNERAARPIAEVMHKRGPEEAVAVWDDIAKAHDGQVTAKQVKDFLDDGSGKASRANSKPPKRLEDRVADIGDAWARGPDKKLERLEREIEKRQVGKLPKRAQEKALRYAVWFDDAAARMRELAALGEDDVSG